MVSRNATSGSGMKCGHGFVIVARIVGQEVFLVSDKDNGLTRFTSRTNALEQWKTQFEQFRISIGFSKVFENNPRQQTPTRYLDVIFKRIRLKF